MEKFILKDGIFLNDTSDCESSFSVDGENIVASVSCEKLKSLTEKAVKKLKAPIFFFAEVPCSEDEEKAFGGGLHKSIYYLDNCTTDVGLAIIKRYSDLLFSDGLLQFGFGSHVDNSEIFHQKYQVVSIYSPEISKFEGILKDSGINKVSETSLLWDKISPENPGECVLVEANGETIYDMILNLTDAGLYKESVVED